MTDDQDLLGLLATLDAQHAEETVAYPDGMTLTRCCGSLLGSNALRHHREGRNVVDYYTPEQRRAWYEMHPQARRSR